MSEQKEIKIEADDYPNFNVFPDEGSSENPGDPSIDNPEEAKPVWFPSSKGRSIVWEHITWVAETQRAACNYCAAEFQIKGGTSALLRHLKTIHPAAINFDPENPPPVVRRKKRKLEDYTIVTEDTKSYMDNLLEQFLNDESMPRGLLNNPESSSPQPVTPPPRHHPLLNPLGIPVIGGAGDASGGPSSSTAQPPSSQNRADSEIDEVIRSLKKETAQNGLPEPEQPDQDLRKLLGIDDGQCEEVIAISASGGNGMGAEPVHPDEEKQVSSSSGQNSAKKRKMEEMMRSAPPPPMSAMEMPGLNCGKFPLSILSAIRRPPGPHHPTIAATSSSTTVVPIGLSSHHHHHPNHHHHNTNTINGAAPPVIPSIPSMPGIPGKYNAQAVSILDFEAKVLYNQSLHSTIAREDAMCTYYRMKSRKMELEIKKLERELGEEQDDPQDE